MWQQQQDTQAKSRPDKRTEANAHNNHSEQAGETLPHLILMLPSCLFNTIIGPQNHDQGHLLSTKGCQIGIQDLHDLLFIQQVRVELQVLVRDLMQLLSYIPL